MDYDYTESECLVFFGIRLLGKVEFEDDKDPRALRAEAHGLGVWSGRRYPPVDPGEPEHFLLIGRYLTSVGYGGSCEDSVSVSELGDEIASVSTSLREAGFTEGADLWAQ